MRGQRPPKGPSQPDPMKTSVGYIGADTFERDRKRRQDGAKAFKARTSSFKGRR